MWCESLTHLVVLEALSDAFAIIRLLSFFPLQTVSYGDEAPLEVVSNCHRVFGLVTAGLTHKENSSCCTRILLVLVGLVLTFGVGEGLDDEVERVLGLGDDDLLEKVLEKLVDLVGLEELLDLVHVVMLLQFVHF